MSEEQLKAFLEKVQDDTSLQEKLQAAADANAVTAIAKEAGFSISADDINKTQIDISEDELEGVAGGRQFCIVDSARDWHAHTMTPCLNHGQPWSDL